MVLDGRPDDGLIIATLELSFQPMWIISERRRLHWASEISIFSSSGSVHSEASPGYKDERE